MRTTYSRLLQHAVAIAVLVIGLLAVLYFGKDLGTFIAERILRN